MTAGEETHEMGPWIKDLAAGRPTFADRQSPDHPVRRSRLRRSRPAGQPVIPEPNGEQAITGHSIGQLLDKLDELTGG